MKKILFLAIALVLGTSFTTNAQEAKKEMTTKTPEKGAIIEFDKEVIDYGEVEYASNGERFFTITNTGNEPLVITRAKGSCGCTVPVWPKEPILPGKTAELKVKYDTKRGGQPFAKSVTVYSNAVNEPTKVVKIKGKVLQDPNKITVKKPAAAVNADMKSKN